jgi:S-(hydroxymethyl)glutathione dehydrogenase / alcohol dehydrogenase
VRGAVLRAVGEPLVVADDLQLREPGPGEVRVALRASGVCHSDLSVQNGTFGSARLPLTLGHEGAGEVLSVGPGVTGIAPGDHVILVWVPPCGRCRICLGGQPQLCTEVRRSRAGLASPLSDSAGAVTLGFGIGTFTEETVVPEQAVVAIDPSVPFDVAALVGCGVMTGVGAVINTAQVEPGASVAVIGCGGVGVNVVQGARLSGAAVIVAVDPVPGKRETARSFGATHVVDPAGLADLVRELTLGAGFDYVFEVVGRSGTLRQAWDATRRGGVTVAVGAGSSTDMVSFSAGELYASERKLLGCLYGSADVRRDFHRMLALWQAGRLDLTGLVSREIGLDEVNEAFAAMEGGEVIRSVIRF